MSFFVYWRNSIVCVNILQFRKADLINAVLRIAPLYLIMDSVLSRLLAYLLTSRPPQSYQSFIVHSTAKPLCFACDCWPTLPRPYHMTYLCFILYQLFHSSLFDVSSCLFVSFLTVYYGRYALRTDCFHSIFHNSRLTLVP